MSNKDRMLIIGLGTGRSGTKCLASLLSKQKDMQSSHESNPKLPWKLNENLLNFKIANMIKSRKSLFIADVASYWLPYVNLIDKNSPIAVNFICIKRNKEDTIRSFVKKTGGSKGGKNPWIDHDGTTWKKYPWDERFPSFPVQTKEEGINKYWEYYYKEAEVMAANKDNFNIWPIEALNDKISVRNMLEACRIESPIIDMTHIEKRRRRVEQRLF